MKVLDWIKVGFFFIAGVIMSIFGLKMKRLEKKVVKQEYQIQKDKKQKEVYTENITKTEEYTKEKEKIDTKQKAKEDEIQNADKKKVNALGNAIVNDFNSRHKL